MKKSLKVILIILIVVISIASLGYMYFKGIDVDTMTVKAQDYSQSFKENGYVVSNNIKSVYSMTNGEITLKDLKVGDIVKQGDIIATIDTKPIDYKINQLNAQIKSTQAQKRQIATSPNQSEIDAIILQIQNSKSQLMLAEKDLERINKLYEEGQVSKTDYERAEQVVKSLENTIKQSENSIKVLEDKNKPTNGSYAYYEALIEGLNYQIEALNYEKSKAIIKSPISGIVNSMNINSGNVVAVGTKIFEVFEPDKYKIETYILTKDINDLKIDMDVECVLKSTEKDLSFKGKISKIAPTAENKISSLGLEEQRIKVTISLENTQDILKPGYSVDVKFTTLNKPNSIVVPKTVVFPFEDGDAIWIVNDSKAYIKKVETAQEDNKDIVISSGLKKDELIILNPNIKGLKEGRRVY